MSKPLPKIIAILLGIVFLVGGAHTASAAPTTTVWAFEYTLINPLSVAGIGLSGVEGQILSFNSLAACEKAESSYTWDFSLTGRTYSITRSCYQTTEGALEPLRAAARANIASADIGPTALDKFNLWCGLPLPGLSKYNLTDCIPSVVYYVIYKPASWFLVGSGYIFDAMLTLSIDSSFINQEFVESIWLIVRDFSNMFFIFILIFTGVQTILNMGNWKNTIKLVIIMALLINFSLFFTKVVIDAGNILAVGIYSSMGTEKSAVNQSFQVVGSVPERDISGRLAAAFQPQQFLDSAGKVDALDATVVFLVAAVVSGYAGYVFFKVALLFIGRLIAFWFLMIASPFAFISIALPGKANKFQEWLNELTNQAFVAPVFLFFVYIIMQVLNAGDGILTGLIKTSPTTIGPFTFDKVLGPVIIASLLVLALQKALEFAKDLSGKFGDLGAGIGGAALGIATGGAAMVGRGVVGGAASTILKSGWLQEKALGGSKWAERATLTANSLQKATFDPRNLGGKDSAFGKTIGGGIAKGIKSLGVGEGGGKGGYQKTELDKEKKADIEARERAELFQLTSKEKNKNIEEAKNTEKAHEEAKKAHEEAKKNVAEKMSREEVATKKLEEAQTAHDTNLLSENVNPNLKRVLDEAKKEASEAKKAREDAEKEAAEKEKQSTQAREREEEAKKKTEKETARRREIHAKQAEERGQHATAEKIRKGTPVEKESALDKLKKEIKEDQEKETKEKGNAPGH